MPEQTETVPASRREDEPYPAGGDDARVYEVLHAVIDPEVGVNIVDLGLVYAVHVAERVVHVRMTLTTPGCPLGSYLEDEIRRAVAELRDVDDIELDLVWDPPWDPEMMTDEAKRQLGWIR